MPKGQRALFFVARACWAVGVAAFVLLLSADAHAYPWMLRHGYTSCAGCHADPSGAGPLTQYGRMIADSVLPQAADRGEPRTGFLFGAVPTPEWISFNADTRLLWLRTDTSQAELTDRVIWMQLDASVAIDYAGFVAVGSLGYADQGALGAALTRGTEHNLVSRQHWLGYRFDKAGLLLRAGRMNLPFGLRTIEHTLLVRKETRTDVNDDQQAGVALALNQGMWRGELMGILGNYQLRPDDYRERGYSAYLEVAPQEQVALGVSSLITHRDLDPVTLKETWRQAHGLFARWATPWEPLVMLTEWDYTLSSSRDEFHRKGLVSYLQADFEPAQGVHFLMAGELSHVGMQNQYWGYGGWLSYWWFFMPRADLRLDGIYQSVGSAAGRQGSFSLLLQGHIRL
jgi:hypothetical protein